MSWPIGMGKNFKGIYRFYDDTVHLFAGRAGNEDGDDLLIQGLENQAVESALGNMADALRDEVELVKGASHTFDPAEFLAGGQTPVFFGAAINNLGVGELIDNFVAYAPPPGNREAESRRVEPAEFKVFGICIQDSGEYGPRPPRPDCFSTNYLRSVYQRYEASPTCVPERICWSAMRLLLWQQNVTR